MYDVFILCGGKCGGTTLANTFNFYNYKVAHLHSPTCVGSFEYNQFNSLDNRIKNKLKNDNSFFEILEQSSKNKKIYVIDSYRNPIERTVSSFFQNIEKKLPNYKELEINTIIDIFNNNFLHKLDQYHPIDDILLHYKIDKQDKFDFDKGYQLINFDNIVFIKLLFDNIDKWNITLSEIFDREIVLQSTNLTKNKPIGDLYNKFYQLYKIPKYSLNLISDNYYFKYYNTENQQQDYINNWLLKSK